MRKYFKVPYKAEFTKLHGYNLPKEADDAQLKLLLCFPSEPGYRTLSQTHDVLYEYIKGEFGSRVFVDFAFENPALLASSRKTLDEWQGVISGGKMSEFNVVGVSIAVSGPEIIRTFKHLYPRRPNSKQFFVLGGAAADTAYSIYSLFDAVVLGFAEGPLGYLLNNLLTPHPDGILPRLNDHPNIVVPSLTSDVTKTPNVDIYPGALTVPKETHVLPYTQGISRASIPISIGCLGRACSFCHEGCTQGVFRASEFDDIALQLEQVKRATMADSISFQSCSFNLHPRAKDILIEASKHFSHIQSLNFRADGIVSDPQLLPLLKKLGITTVAFGVEGVSDGIRNLLNKSLSRQTLLAAVEQVFSLGFSKLKMGFILTGYESRTDIDEFKETIRDMKVLARSRGAKTRIQITYTDLIHYPGTPLFRFKRKLAAHRMGMSGTDLCVDEVFKDLDGVTVQYAESAGKNYITQLLFDLDPGVSFSLLKYITSSDQLLGSKGMAEGIKDFLKAKHDIRVHNVFMEPDKSRYRPVPYIKTWGDYQFKVGDTPASCREGCVDCGQCPSIGEDFSPRFDSIPATLDADACKDKMRPSYLTAYFVWFDKVHTESDKELLFRAFLARHACNPYEMVDIIAGSPAFSELQRYPSHHYGMEYFYVRSTAPLILDSQPEQGVEVRHVSVQDFKVIPSFYARYSLHLTPYEMSQAKGIFSAFNAGSEFSYRGSLHRYQYQSVFVNLWYEPTHYGMDIYQPLGINPAWYLTYGSTLKAVQDIVPCIEGYYTLHVPSRTLFNVLETDEVDLTKLTRVG